MITFIMKVCTNHYHHRINLFIKLSMPHLASCEISLA
nr:MAG TPA_asm: hypothetical protein [Caudoviricetes sp.]